MGQTAFALRIAGLEAENRGQGSGVRKQDKKL
jgi:hypothetical protein